MEKVKVVNIKCGGCEAGIMEALTRVGLKSVRVDHSCQEVTFEGDKEIAIKLLDKMGYPEEGSKKAKSLAKKTKSYISCAIGKAKKKK